MNLHQLRYALAVMEARSFSRAAESCHVSQPSLSVAVAQLEAELGEALFDRTTRRVEVTPFGEYLASAMQDAMRGIEEVRLAAERFRGSADQVVRLGLSPLIDGRLLKRVIEPFERGWPGGQVILKECMLGDLEQRLETHKIDAAVTLAEARPQARIGRSPFYTEPLLYLPQGGEPDPVGGPVPIRELGGRTFVLTMDGCGLANSIRKLFHRSGVRLQEYPGQALSYDVVEEWVGLGIGASILPESKVKALRSCARPIVKNNRQTASLSYELKWNARRRQRECVTAFVKHFRAVGEHLVRGGGRVPHKK